MVNKKKLIIILILLIFVITIGITYALWNSLFTQTGHNNEITDCFNIEYSDTDAVFISNAYPQTDSEGLENMAYEVTISNTCQTVATYNIIFNKIATESTLEDEHIKVAINDEVKHLSELESTTTSVTNLASARIIKEDYIAGNSTKTEKIKVWMDEGTTNAQALGKSFKYKVTIESTATTNRWLAAEVLNSNTVYSTVPTATQFQNGEPYSDGTVGSGSGIFKAQDNDGESFYLRGQIENNYVSFANKLWRVVRINGDRSIRLILDSVISTNVRFNNDGNGHKYVGYTYDNSKICTNASPCDGTEGTNSTIKTFVDNWYATNLISYESKIATSTYCNDTSYSVNVDQYRYSTRQRVYVNFAPSLICPDTSEYYGGLYKLKVGLITADEVMMAGYNGNQIAGSPLTYLIATFRTMSPYTSASTESYVCVTNSRTLKQTGTDVSLFFPRPVINLIADAKISSGNGTSSKPYVIDMN